jgi:SAM-dependent methyltransferase
MAGTYVIRGGLEGRERLRMLGRVIWPTTEVLLARVGIPPDAQCLDVGCGGGDVTVAIARLVPDGSVVGIDYDAEKVVLARDEAASAHCRNVEYRVADVMDPPGNGEFFDVVYARFLLTHLPDPVVAATNMAAQLEPGGVLIVEDIDFRGHFCEPHCQAFRRFVDWYTQAVQGRGCDPNIGPRLPGILRDAGLADIDMHVVQPAGFTGEVKLITAITLEAIADSVLDAGIATVDEFNATVDELYEFARTDGTVMSVPRIVQSWGRRPSHA